MGKSTTLKASETKLFWQTVSELRRIKRENIHGLELAHAADELDVIREYTDSPLLKQRIDAVLSPGQEKPCGSSA